MAPPQEHDPQVAAVGQDWMPTGSIIVGVWVLASSWPEAVRLVMNVAFLTHFDSSTAPMANLDVYTGAASVSIQLLVGLGLVFGAGGLSRFIRWARRAGVAKGPSESPRGE